MFFNDFFNRKPILVTGAHRSGTTWVGQMLSLHHHIGYIHEIFNLSGGLLKDEKVFNYWFQYINEDYSGRYAKYVEDVLKFKYCKESYAHKLKCRLLKRPLLKDPIAAFSSNWLADRFNMDVVVVIRHPAAFVASLKRLNWRFDFSNFIVQEKLMSDHLHEFEGKIKKSNMDIIEMGALLWLCIYHVLCKYLQDNPRWILKRHEDLSREPEVEFADIYKRLSIPFNDKISRTIRDYSCSGNPTSAPKNEVHYLMRNSKNNIKHWHNALSETEIETIRKIVSELSDKYYGIADW